MKAIEITIDDSTAEYLERLAKQKGLSLEELASEVVEAAAAHNVLYSEAAQ